MPDKITKQLQDLLRSTRLKPRNREGGTKSKFLNEQVRKARQAPLINKRKKRSINPPRKPVRR